MTVATAPNFFIVGAPKAGTTSLYHYLNNHPEVYMSPIKEPCYFAPDVIAASRPFYRRQVRRNYRAFLKHRGRRVIQRAFVDNRQDYMRLFEAATGQPAVGEASACYLLSRVAAAAIGEKLPNARIIAILRDPVERAYSHHLMNIRAGSATKSFIEELEDGRRPENRGWYPAYFYILRGLYFEQIKRYLDAFSRERVKILFYDDLKSDLNGFLKSVYEFLEVNPEFQAPTGERFNQARMPRAPLLNHLVHRAHLKTWFGRVAPPWMSDLVWDLWFTRKQIPRITPEERQAALPYFREDVERLQELLRRDLSQWLR